MPLGCKPIRQGNENIKAQGVIRYETIAAIIPIIAAVAIVPVLIISTHIVATVIIAGIVVEIIVVVVDTIKLFFTDDNNCSVDSKYIASSSNFVEYPKIDLYQSKVKPSQTIILIGLELKERKIIVNKGK